MDSGVIRSLWAGGSGADGRDRRSCRSLRFILPHVVVMAAVQPGFGFVCVDGNPIPEPTRLNTSVVMGTATGFGPTLQMYFCVCCASRRNPSIARSSRYSPTECLQNE